MTNLNIHSHAIIWCCHEAAQIDDHHKRSQNAEVVTYIKERLLKRAVVPPFQTGTSLKGKNLLPKGAKLFLQLLL